MAVSMDPVNLSIAPVPPRAPLAMADQDLGTAPKTTFSPPGFATWFARLLTFGGALALTIWACYQMVLIVSLAQITIFQWVMVILFTLTFGWIALTATGSIAGVLVGEPRPRSPSNALIKHRTVLLMPVYNEDPAHTYAALHSMGKALLAEGLGKHFEIFVISDTQDPDIWVKETAAVHRVRESLAGNIPVWYRRRHDNAGKKAGNIRDFIQQWGERYDFMVVLDADSLLTPQTLGTLVREMAADPSCGILQTLPRLSGGNTLFARLQQFAGSIYGPIIARGITAWQGEDGNYWGHNAIIRVTAFAQAAGLPRLPGRRPFGGDIMSHDFVEAALIRRAGWSVRMLPWLEGSWEESPPSLATVATRDRRWAQGNLQHLAVCKTKGLRWPNRAHMLIGVMSYLASPLWLALMVAGLLTAMHAATASFDYFKEDFTLFPNWPVFDSERMIGLFVLTMTVLLLPKILGLLRALFHTRLRRQLGTLRLIAGSLLETTFSVLYAPIFMLIHSRHIWDILRGRDSGWSAQQRRSQGVPWLSLIKQHGGHTILGLVTTAGLTYLSLPLLGWMSPILAGLILAIPLAAISGSRVWGRALNWCGLLRIPEDVSRPAVMTRRDDFEAVLHHEVEQLDVARLVQSPPLWKRHFSMVPPPPPPKRGQPDLARASAEMKISDAYTINEALQWLDRRETLALLNHRHLLQQLAALQRTHQTQPSPNTPVLTPLAATGTSGVELQTD